MPAALRTEGVVHLWSGGCIAFLMRHFSPQFCRIVARDIGGGDPERMAAPKATEYLLATFSSAVKVWLHMVH